MAMLDRHLVYIHIIYWGNHCVLRNMAFLKFYLYHGSMQEKLSPQKT